MLVPDLPKPPADCRFHICRDAVMPNCRWSRRDKVVVTSCRFDSSWCPRAAGPPAPEDAAIRGQTLRLVFETLPTEAHRALVEYVVEEQRSGPNGVMFRAARRVTRGEEDIDPQFIRAQEPALLEVAPDHFVACDLYPRPYRADGGLNRLTRGTRPTRG